VAHLFFEERAIDGGEGFDGDKEVGAGGAPGRAVLGEAPAWDEVVDVGVILELPTPGMEDAGEPWEISPDETLVCSESFEGERRGGEHGVVGGALMRADEGAERLRDGEGEEEVRPGKLALQVVMKPLLGFMLLALGTVPVAAGMRDAVLFLTVWALIKAMAIGAAAAVLDGADDFAVHEGEVGVTLQILRGKGGEDVAEGGHGSSPCMRVLRRS
jgi:hypothetical protein